MPVYGEVTARAVIWLSSGERKGYLRPAYSVLVAQRGPCVADWLRLRERLRAAVALKVNLFHAAEPFWRVLLTFEVVHALITVPAEEDEVGEVLCIGLRQGWVVARRVWVQPAKVRDLASWKELPSRRRPQPQGSILLGAHVADVSFGNVTVNALP